jgi:flagellar biosynthesis protein FlhF
MGAWSSDMMMPGSAREGATLLAFPNRQQSPHGKLAASLKYHRLPERLVESLVTAVSGWPDRSLEEALACVLATRLCIVPVDLEKSRGILLLGPSGAGKSAVAAKLARAAALAGRDVELTGATEGLALFRTGTHPAGRLTIMEADGFNPTNARACNAFAALGEIEGVDTVGVVSATADAEDIQEIVTSLRFRRVIVTGLDRTKRLGATLAAITGIARLAHVTAGPRPDDPLERLTAPVLAKALLETP